MARRTRSRLPGQPVPRAGLTRTAVTEVAIDLAAETFVAALKGLLPAFKQYVPDELDLHAPVLVQFPNPSSSIWATIVCARR